MDLNINEPGLSQLAQYEDISITIDFYNLHWTNLWLEQLDIHDIEPLKDNEAISTFGNNKCVFMLSSIKHLLWIWD